MLQRKWTDLREFLALIESKNDVVHIDDQGDST